MNRKIDGDVLVQHLKRDEQMIDTKLVAEHGRSARTLVKEGKLRLTMIAVAPGGELPTHSTNGPITVQVMEGKIAFTALEKEYDLNVGDIIVLAPGVEHSVRSADGGMFLLTVVHEPSAGSRATDV